MFADDLIVLDFETTGLSPDSGDRITEVAALRLKDGKIVDRYQSLVNCGVRVPDFITDLTGITQAMVDRAPPVKRVISELLAYIGETAVVAHNASFDQKFFESECALADRTSQHKTFICSMRISRRIYPHLASHSLPVLARRLEITYKGAAHRAEADAEVAAHLMLRMARDMRARHGQLTLDAGQLRKIMRMTADKAGEFLSRLAEGSEGRDKGPGRKAG